MQPDNTVHPPNSKAARRQELLAEIAQEYNRHKEGTALALFTETEFLLNGLETAILGIPVEDDTTIVGLQSILIEAFSRLKLATLKYQIELLDRN